MTRKRSGIIVVAGVVLAGAAAIALLLWERGDPAPRFVEDGRDLGRCPGCSLLLVTFDTLRADHLPCYGHPADTAPRFCGLAREGLLYEHAVSPAPITIPSLISLHSGSIAANEALLDLLAHYDGQRFLAEDLKDAGFSTAAFTDHRGFGDKGHRRIGSLFFSRGFDDWTNIGEGRDSRNAAPLTDLALAWLREHSKERFFLWIHYFDPHWNYMPAPEDERRFGFDPARCGRIRNGIDQVELSPADPPLERREGECLAALHQAEIFATDREAGRLIDEIERLGLAGSTLVAFTSDHGEEFLEHGHLGHERTVYEELVHVPLVVVNPRERRVGRVRDGLSTARLREMLLAALADRPIPATPGELVTRAHHYQGREEGRLEGLTSRPNEFALYGDGHKLIYVPRTERAELYDLRGDPGEQRDLGAGAARASALWPRLTAWLEAHTAPSVPPGQDSIEMQRELRERLERLGYVR